ncbi:MAG: class I SAM-dependent methyltransferase [Actinomycetota bacterium]
MSEEPASIAFDRAAEYYDRTRVITPEASEAMTQMLAGEMRGRDRCLEIGVGTGLVSLPLHAAGIRMVGVDLSRPMLNKLIEKAGGRPPFPLVVGDATRLPLPDRCFDAALARHVLHLIPRWRDAVRELGRILRPGGVLMLNIGVKGGQGPWDEVIDRLEARVGSEARRKGLDLDDHAQLDEVVESFGGRLRVLPTLWQASELTLRTFFEEIEAGFYSWTWGVDHETLATAVSDARRWAEERFGGFDEVLEPRFPIAWRAYDLAR